MRFAAGFIDFGYHAILTFVAFGLGDLEAGSKPGRQYVLHQGYSCGARVVSRTTPAANSNHLTCVAGP